MTKSAKIRELSQQGLTVTEIARQMGIRYQHAYGVLNSYKPKAGSEKRVLKAEPQPKPPLHVAELLAAGFVLGATLKIQDHHTLTLSTKLPAAQGVYAFVVGDQAMYVGVATMGLAKRIYYYCSPTAGQRTNLRVRDLLVGLLSNGTTVSLYYAQPEDLHWNNMPVHGAAGLEMGLIKKHFLPWNKKSTN